MTAKIVTHQERKIVLGNFTSLTTLQGISYILPLIILPYLIRAVGMEKFGLIAFAQALVQYFVILTDYGFSLSATRSIALIGEHKKQVSALFSSVMTVKLIFAAISFLILCAILYFIPRFKEDWLVYLLSFGTVIGNTLFPVWFFQGKEKMSYIAIVNVISGITYAICIFMFIKGPDNYLLVPLLGSLLAIISGILGLYIAFKKFRLAFVLQRYADIKREIKTGWDIFISILAINIYTTSRVFAVGLLTNNVLTGYYSVAERIANVIQTFPMDSFTRAVYPRISHVFARNKQRAAAIMYRIQDGITLGFVISLPIAYLIAPWIINLASGGAYQEVVFTFRLLLAAVFFVGANNFKVQFLLVCGKEDLYAKIHILAALTGLPLIFILIKQFSYAGAALATVLTEAGVFILTSLIIEKLAKKISGK
ncbi:MAG: flippase [Candidatus Omnitrophica bacterium CG11_big_fil_rev_8_21_14_0_20_43_6]|nr:MAG: flippase [Candidatus Omnitrophica bacterium CG11_big_fil_rev_8_21_14_0_20_43_6]